MAEAESLLSSVGELHQQRTSAEGSAGQLSLAGGKSPSGEIPARSGEVQFKWYRCAYTRHCWFPTWAAQRSPLSSQALSSRTETGVCSRDSDGQGPVVEARAAQGAAGHRPAGSSPWREAGWHGTAKPPARKWPKCLLTGKAGAAAIYTLGKQTTLRTSPRCQCLNLVAAFRGVNLFQK